MTPDSPLPGEDLVGHLVSSDLFGPLDRAAAAEVAGELTWVTLTAGETLLTEGEKSDALYLVVSGTLQASRRHQDGSELVVGHVGPGDSVGGIVVLGGGVRTANVRVTSDCRLIKIPKVACDALRRRDARFVSALATAMRRQIRRNQLVSGLPRLLGRLGEAEREAIEAECDWVHLRAGDVLFRQHDAGDSLFLVLSGRLRVTMAGPDGQERTLGEVVRGESVGEMALVSGQPRAATVSAIRNTTLARLSRTAFERILERHPRAMFDVTRTVVRRWEQAIQPTRLPQNVNVAIVAAGPTVPMDDFSRRLTETLATGASVLRLTSDEVDTALGIAGIAQRGEDDMDGNLMLDGWLDEREFEHRLIIYQADVSSSAWTQRCLRRADHIVIVGQAGADPKRGVVEATLLDEHTTTSARRTLVLLHANENRRPSATRAWLACRRIDQHHHVRWNQRADFERLARFVSGRPTGLVLGGGGARGFAHIGVLRGLSEANVPIDYVGGTSMGAFIAGLHAFGIGLDDMVPTCRDMVRRNLFDVTLPVVSIVASRWVSRKLAELFEDVDIEDLWTPYFSIASNLTRAEVRVQKTGKVWKGIRASAGVPGVAPPVCDGADLLVDGGLLDNLPIGIMREHCDRGAVIAVDVSPKVDLVPMTDYGASLSGWSVLWSRLNPFRRSLDVPSIVRVLTRSSALSSIYADRRANSQALADLYLSPPVGAFRMLEMGALDRVVEAGYLSTRDEIASWQAARATAYSRLADDT